MLDLRILRDRWTEEGGREVFADLVTACVRSIHPEAQAVRPDPGDEGLDTFVGDFAGELRVYQAKYFCDDIGASQKAQVRESWRRCQESSMFKKVVAWTLCVPIELSVPEHRWWQRWSKRESEQTGCVIELWSRSHFNSFYAREDLRQRFDVALERGVSFESAGALRAELARLGSVLAIEQLPSHDHLKGALFVRKLEAAGWLQHRAARTAFYNFELLRSTVELGGTPAEMAALTELRERVFELWESAFNEHAPDNLGKALVKEVQRRIRDEHTSRLKSTLPAGEMHKVGAIHDWADHCFAGWTLGFESLAEQSEAR